MQINTGICLLKPLTSQDWQSQGWSFTATLSEDLNASHRGRPGLMRDGLWRHMRLSKGALRYLEFVNTGFFRQLSDTNSTWGSTPRACHQSKWRKHSAKKMISVHTRHTHFQNDGRTHTCTSTSTPSHSPCRALINYWKWCCKAWTLSILELLILRWLGVLLE